MPTDVEYFFRNPGEVHDVYYNVNIAPIYGNLFAQFFCLDCAYDWN